jgi:DNA-binding Lrp family transcriptional regulator
MQTADVIKRMGIIVRHHELGFSANAMSVWDVPDEQVDALGQCIRKYDFVTLCYRRQRQLPQWRYNLYCMVHGRDRATVQGHLQQLISQCGLQEHPHEVLFSTRRFKQCGARYVEPAKAA